MTKSPASIDPKISIVIPMYNAEKYVETCINSILGQTFRDFELILIDDCSTDRSAEIVQHYQDPRIRLFKLGKNSGAGAAMNHGIKISRGEFVSIVDSDDALMPNAIQTLLDVAEKFNADIVHMSSYYAAKNEDFQINKVIQVQTVKESNVQIGLQSRKFKDRIGILGASIFFPVWLNFFRGDFLRDRKIFLPEFSDGSYDVFFTIATLCIAERFVKIDSPMYIYRKLSSDSFTNSNADIKLERFFTSLPVMLNYMRDLFQRDDILEPLSYSMQVNLTSNLIALIFQNLYQKSDERISNLVSKISNRPEFYSRKFFENYMGIFCQLLRSVK